MNKALASFNKILPTTAVESEGGYIPNLNKIKQGNFVYEGFNRNRYLRYTGLEKTYKEVRNTPGRGDIRTHNIDLISNVIYIENNNSQWCNIQFNNADDARTSFLYLINRTDEQLLNQE